MAQDIDHESIIKYHYIGYTDGKIDYIIMDYANGGNLQEFLNDRIKTGNQIENNDLVTYFVEISTGMKFLNEKVVHRDIKPENILLHNGRFKISDFGLSKISGKGTRTLTFKGYGTPSYIAPEAWVNDRNTIQMDIYSMGIVFYVLATLNYPYKIGGNHSIMDYEQIIMKMMSKSTDNRYHNWDEILNDLYKISSNGVAIKDKYVESALLKRRTIDEKREIELLKKEQERLNEQQYIEKINYRIKDSIITPLMMFINEFNDVYNKDAQYQFDQPSKSNEDIIFYRIITPDQHEILFKFRIIFKNSLKRKRTSPLSNTPYDEYYTPQLKNSDILLWGGFFEQKSGLGYNIILVESEADMYGKLYILKNTNSGLSHSRRRAPFAFSLDELPSEINYINAIHIYSTEVLEFSIESIKEFVSSFV
jgi:serine/threonine protein kinase